MTVERIKIDAKRKNEKEKKKKRLHRKCKKKKPSEMPTNRNKTTQFTNISII